jgi:hypothetical protein
MKGGKKSTSPGLGTLHPDIMLLFASSACLSSSARLQNGALCCKSQIDRAMTPHRSPPCRYTPLRSELDQSEMLVDVRAESAPDNCVRLSSPFNSTDDSGMGRSECQVELRNDGGVADGTGGVGGGGGAWGRGGGGDGYGKEDPLPDDLSRALAAGALSSEALARYLAYAKAANPLTRLIIGIPAFRTRILADSGFLFKLVVQELVGNGTGLASEIVVRGKEIVNELEYVASDLIVGTVVEAGFVWLLAPRLASTSSVVDPGILTRFFESLPANAFEASTALRKYSLPLRFASFANAGLQYAAVGMVAGIVGTAITYSLIEGRKRFDPKYVPDRPLPPILASSAGWAAFMALSSNPRFQAVEGIERALNAALQGSGVQGAILKTSIVALRFGNNYWGGVQFINFFRYLGLQAIAE